MSDSKLLRRYSKMWPIPDIPTHLIKSTSSSSRRMPLLTRSTNTSRMWMPMVCYTSSISILSILGFDAERPHFTAQAAKSRTSGRAVWRYLNVDRTSPMLFWPLIPTPQVFSAQITQQYLNTLQTLVGDGPIDYIGAFTRQPRSELHANTDTTEQDSTVTIQ